MPTASPIVSFVVPCYKLAHLLPECINSILGQSYGNFEVLVMDDCSPDHAAEVARSFQDPRVKYMRNDSNLGALGNYNKGIRLSRGKFVWLISADDYLRRPYVLQRYVDLMEADSRIGYTFCPGVGVTNEKETGLLTYSTYGNRDRVIDGRVFLQKLSYNNLVVAPTALARRECYDKISFFPINPVWSGEQVDLIWAGDWYLWCVFALHYDVGYFAEPMVCYREHDLSTTSILTKESIENCFRAEIAVPWRVKWEADQAGFREVSRKCLQSIAAEYARHLTTKQYRSSASTITLTQFEQSLCRNTANEEERAWIRGHVFAEMGDRHHHREDFASARKSYRVATQIDPWMIKAQAKKLLLSMGRPGDYLRRSLQRFR